MRGKRRDVRIRAAIARPMRAVNIAAPTAPAPATKRKLFVIAAVQPALDERNLSSGRRQGAMPPRVTPPVGLIEFGLIRRLDQFSNSAPVLIGVPSLN